MGASERIVRHLRLRADSEAGVRRAALKLEDALRCASLPDAGARVLLVRRLELGLMAAGASPQTLSLLLEQRVAAAGGTWVHGAEPGADRADFVFFRDALEARCELALRIARAAPSAAWFWPLAVAEFEPAEDAQANLRRIALAIAALPEAPAALPAWIARLTAAGVAPVLARAIGPVESATLLRAARLSSEVPRPRTVPLEASGLRRLASGAQDGERAESLRRPELAPAFAALPLWMQRLARAGGFARHVVPGMSGVPPAAQGARSAPPVPAVRFAPATAAGPSRASKERIFQKNADVETPVASSTPDTSAKPPQESPKPKGIPGEAAHFHGRLESVMTEGEPEPPWSGGAFPAAAPSTFGGLLFLLPVLQRLGYASWAEALPEGAAAQVAGQLLTSVLRRLDASPDDSAWLLACVSDDDFGGIGAKAPAIWSDPTLVAPRGSAAKDIVAQAEQAQPAAALARIWLIACRRWLRRVAGVGVASLVVRPAAIGVTATHADVFFRVNDADMRVRRAGLDLDPGWVPWVGRVVSFHYGRIDHASADLVAGHP